MSFALAAWAELHGPNSPNILCPPTPDFTAWRFHSCKSPKPSCIQDLPNQKPSCPAAAIFVLLLLPPLGVQDKIITALVTVARGPQDFGGFCRAVAGDVGLFSARWHKDQGQMGKSIAHTWSSLKHHVYRVTTELGAAPCPGATRSHHGTNPPAQTLPVTANGSQSPVQNHLITTERGSGQRTWPWVDTTTPGPACCEDPAAPALFPLVLPRGRCVAAAPPALRPLASAAMGLTRLLTQMHKYIIAAPKASIINQWREMGASSRDGKNHAEAGGGSPPPPHSHRGAGGGGTIPPVPPSCSLLSIPMGQ